MKHLWVFMALPCAISLFGCQDEMALAESSFGKIGHKDSRAGSVSVISMGRDDDDGKAKIWHIGGKID